MPTAARQTATATLARPAPAGFSDAEMLGLSRGLKGWAYRLTRGDAGRVEDLVQSTFLRMIQKRHMFVPEPGRSRMASLFAWSCAIMRHELLNGLRQERKIKRRNGKWELNEAHYQLDDALAESLPDVSAPDACLELQQTLKLLADDGQRGQVVLLIGLGYSLEEVAQELELNPNTVKTKLSRGRNRVEAKLGRQKQAGRRSWERSLSRRAG